MNVAKESDGLTKIYQAFICPVRAVLQFLQLVNQNHCSIDTVALFHLFADFFFVHFSLTTELFSSKPFFSLIYSTKRRFPACSAFVSWVRRRHWHHKQRRLHRHHKQHHRHHRHKRHHLHHLHKQHQQHRHPDLLDLLAAALLHGESPLASGF